MKRTVFAVTASVVLAGTLVAAQSQNPQSPGGSQQPQTSPSASQPSQQKSGSETRLTGCLVQGSSPNVFVLDNARMSTDAKTAEGKKYVVVMADASDLREQVNRQVTITGTTTEKPGSSTSPSSPSPRTSPGQPSQPGQPQATQPGDAGQAGQAAGQAGQPGPRARMTTAAEERDLPRLSAKSIARIADVCTTAE
jgi:hypothetical protein